MLVESHDSFYERIREDARDYLAGKMTSQEFASSVWHEAQNLAQHVPDGERGAVLDDWLRFELWDDELDEVVLGSQPEATRARVEADTAPPSPPPPER